MSRDRKRPKEEEILIWAGVVAQLNRTRTNQLLAESPLPFELFVLLRHFAHDPARRWTVSGLAAAFETPQPGMTKRVGKLNHLGLLDQHDDERDGRKKWFSINRRGRSLLEDVSGAVRADNQLTFSGWSRADVERLHDLLYRLKETLDENRLD